MWKELIKTTLLGTQRTEISEALQQFSEACKLPKVTTPEEHLLELLAVYAPVKKTMIITSEVEIKKSNFGIKRKNNNPRIAGSLNVMLGGMYADVLPEFLNLLVQKGVSLPPSSLPELFEKSLKNPVFWNQIEPVLGEQGKWLLYQNPNWDLLWTEEKEPTDWGNLSKQKKLRRLIQIRNGSEPEKALEQLALNWAKEDWKTKVDLLKEMKTGLSEKDESFLEKCLKEKRKEVRQTAANLLVKIPTSKFSTELYNYVNNFLLLKKGMLEVQIPEAIDEFFSPLLIFSRKKTDFKKGLLAESFGQLFSKISAEKWEERFELEPAQTLKLFLRSNKKELLIEHLIQGLKENHCEQWAAGLLNIWIAGTHNLKFKEWKIEELVPALSSEMFNKIVLLHIGKNEELRGEHSNVLKYLQTSQKAWEDELALRVLLPVKKHISNLQGFDWSAWHYKEVLKTASLRISPKLIGHFSEGWNSQGAGWEMWSNEIEQFLACLKFRSEMHKAFE